MNYYRFNSDKKLYDEGWDRIFGNKDNLLNKKRLNA
jgi:hypothetical protein